MSLREAVEATLVGRNPRLVERCNVQGIVDAIERYGIYDVDELSLALSASFGALQLQVGDAAPPVFLALLKAWLGAGPAGPPSTPAMPMPPSTPSTGNPPATLRSHQLPYAIGPRAKEGVAPRAKEGVRVASSVLSWKVDFKPP